MKLQTLQAQQERIREAAVIGKSVELRGAQCHVAGLLRGADGVELLALQAVAGDCEQGNGARRAPKTLRAQLRAEGADWPDVPLQRVRTVRLDGRDFPVGCVSCRLLAGQEWENAAWLLELLRRGWDPGEIGARDLDGLLLIRIELEGEVPAFSDLSGLPGLRLVVPPYPVARLVEKKLTLPVGEGGGRRRAFCGKDGGPPHWFSIERVHLMDPWRTLGDLAAKSAAGDPDALRRARTEAEALLGRDCPKGLRYPVIEYECEEGITLEFFDRAVLSAAPPVRSGATGWLLSASRATGRHGFPLKAAVIQTPVPEGTDVLRAELFRCYAMTAGAELVLR